MSDAKRTLMVAAASAAIIAIVISALAIKNERDKQVARSEAKYRIAKGAADEMLRLNHAFAVLSNREVADYQIGTFAGSLRREEALSANPDFFAGFEDATAEMDMANQLDRNQQFRETLNGVDLSTFASVFGDEAVADERKAVGIRNENLDNAVAAWRRAISAIYALMKERAVAGTPGHDSNDEIENLYAETEKFLAATRRAQPDVDIFSDRLGKRLSAEVEADEIELHNLGVSLPKVYARSAPDLSDIDNDLYQITDVTFGNGSGAIRGSKKDGTSVQCKYDLKNDVSAQIRDAVPPENIAVGQRLRLYITQGTEVCQVWAATEP